jgi:hypothetical protein
MVPLHDVQTKHLWLRELDAIGLTQTEFKLLIDARNGALNDVGLGVLRAAHERQQTASA